MNVVRNENLWFAVDSYGQNIPDVRNLLARLSTEGVGFSAESISHPAPDLGQTGK